MVFLLRHIESAEGTESFTNDDNTSEQLSIAVTSIKSGGMIVEAHINIVSLGQVMVGAILSLYMIFWIQRAVFLQVSVARYIL
jgi:hypothetical protein